MKQIEEISKGTNYTAVSVGKMSELVDHVLKLAPGVEIPGKVFVGDALDTTGAEISFQTFAPNQEVGFLHTHKVHEELYLFIKGSGEFQADGKVFPVSEGSVVRVAPEAKRTVRNTGDENLVMICVLYKAATFTEQDRTDGNILQEKVEW